MSNYQKSFLTAFILVLVTIFTFLVVIEDNENVGSSERVEVKVTKPVQTADLSNELKKLIPDSNKEVQAPKVELKLRERVKKREKLLGSYSLKEILSNKDEFLKNQKEIQKEKLALKQPLELIDKISIELAIVLSALYRNNIIDSVNYAAEDKNFNSYEWSLMKNFSQSSDFKLLVQSEKLTSEVVNLPQLRKVYGNYQKSGNTKKTIYIPSSSEALEDDD
jgi:hypothetical protein